MRRGEQTEGDNDVVMALMSSLPKLGGVAYVSTGKSLTEIIGSPRSSHSQVPAPFQMHTDRLEAPGGKDLKAQGGQKPDKCETDGSPSFFSNLHAKQQNMLKLLQARRSPAKHHILNVNYDLADA